MTDFHLGATPQPNVGPLANKGILITRPMWQATALAQRLHPLGARPLIFPAIIIEPNPACDVPSAQIRLRACTRAFFVSANAVHEGLRELVTFPPHVRAYGPGPGTAQALRDVGVSAVHTPTQSFDTQGVLAMPELQSLAGERVMLFTGAGGKGELAAGLRARGAIVEVVESYIRRAPASKASGIEDACAAGLVDAAVFTSAEGIKNFWQCLSADGQHRIKSIPSFVPHPAVAAALRAQGVARVVDCGPGDASLIAALRELFQPSST